MTRSGNRPLCLWFCLALVGPRLGVAAAGHVNPILDETGVRGGLVVHVGCGDGRLTAALADDERFLVHGLDTEAANVAQARQHLQSAGLYGRASVDTFDGQHLPYIDNLVNLVVVTRDEGQGTRDQRQVARDEIERVLCPGGVAVRLDPASRSPQPETLFRKPVPNKTDEWTHYLHGPDNNAVAQDSVVAAPYHMQWVAGPLWARHHNHLSSTSAVVTSAGRLFAIVDEGPIATLALRPKWRLVARDAFNGVVLWKKKVGPWEDILRPFRSGPTELSRRLVAIDDRVYVTLGYGQPVVALDAATGDLVRSYDQTAGAVEIIAHDGVLYVVVGNTDRTGHTSAKRRGNAGPPARNRSVVAIQAANGNMLWTKKDVETSGLLPSTLCVSGERVFFQNTDHVVCLNANSGDVHWQTPRPVRIDRWSWSTPTLVVYDDVVMSADSKVAGADKNRGGDDARVEWTVTARPDNGPTAIGELIAFSTQDGRELWRCPTATGYNAPPDVFVADGLVWTGSVPGHTTANLSEGRDLLTGEVKRRLQTDAAFTVTHHHRCYRNKATDRFVFLGRTGVELIDLTGADPVRNCWVRGACQYGVLPANGLLYAPPHACACYIQSKLSGFWALAPERRAESGESRARKDERLEKGPAFDELGARNSERGTETESPASSLRAPRSALRTPPIPHSAFRTPHSEDWPTYRRDAARTGRAETVVPAHARPLWRTKLGGKLSGVVIAEGTLLVAAVDRHTVHALNAETGQPLWKYTAGGRVDSPPTIHESLAIFGCADGYVYCLRLVDGQLVWRFRTAPDDRRTVAFGQVESVWPVTGSVLVHDGTVFCTAGRSSFLDGGMYLYRLDARTGTLVGSARFDSRDPKTGGQREETIEDTELPGALPDVLVYDGEFLYLRDRVLDLTGADVPGHRPHLYSSAGLLDDAWWHRTYWLWGERTWGRASGWGVMPRYRPSGRILVTDEDTVFGYGRRSVNGNTLQGYHLFRADKRVEEIDRVIKNNNEALSTYQRPAKVTEHWSHEIPIVARAMVLTPDALWAAGPVMEARAGTPAEPTFASANPSRLMAFRIDDGTELSCADIEAQPVFDGMAAAHGRLYMATVDGCLSCYGGD